MDAHQQLAKVHALQEQKGGRRGKYERLLQWQAGHMWGLLPSGTVAPTNSCAQNMLCTACPSLPGSLSH